jgi:hypothetical protein
MSADFFDAHERHHQDAELLFNEQRWANADHLYGMAAECGLKRIMEAFGMQLDPTTRSPTQRKDWEHADGAWTRFESYRSGHHQGAGYALPATNPFNDWHVSQRYAHRSHFGAISAQSHQVGAKLVAALIKKAQLEGLI